MTVIDALERIAQTIIEQIAIVKDVHARVQVLERRVQELEGTPVARGQVH